MKKSSSRKRHFRPSRPQRDVLHSPRLTRLLRTQNRYYFSDSLGPDLPHRRIEVRKPLSRLPSDFRSVRHSPTPTPSDLLSVMAPDLTKPRTMPDILRHIICRGRKVRRQVLHALDLVGHKGQGGSRDRRITPSSELRC
ncbi:hypothetical protein [Termite gut associated microvirus 2]|nr:hypothetical protein [Termite gut associated microvirus 2]